MKQKSGSEFVFFFLYESFIYHIHSRNVGKPSQKPIHLLVLGKQLVHQLNVLSLGVGLGGTLQVLPGLPLVLTLQVKNTWLGGRVVANSGLLVQAVQAQQFVVRWTFGQGVNSFGFRGEFSGNHG